jgi:hypothetical protein
MIACIILLTGYFYKLCNFDPSTTKDACLQVIFSSLDALTEYATVSVILKAVGGLR